MLLHNQQAPYRDFCTAAPPDFPVYMYDWYLDAVCQNGTWTAIICRHNGRIAGVWPFFLKQKGPWKFVAMPLLCKFMGPYIVPELRGTKAEQRILQQLTDDLPGGLAAFEQDFPYTVTNWLPMYWAGFRQSTRYSYRLDLLPPLAQVWELVSTNYRKKITKAQQQLQVVHEHPLSEMFRVSMLSFERQGLPHPFQFAYLDRLYTALAARQCCQCFFAQDPATGAIHSAALLIWDRHSAYYIYGGDDPAHRSSGSGVLLQWAAIQYAKEVLQLPIFDFEGSMIRSIEAGRRDFGAQQQAYFRLQKEWSPLWRWAKWLMGR